MEEDAVIFGEEITTLFSSHVEHLKKRRKQRVSSLALKTVVESEETAQSERPAAGDDALFVDPQPLVIPVSTNSADDDLALNATMLPTDQFEGDLVLRRLQILLSRVDDRGYLRSRQQVRFHDAFIRATSRVIYKSDWSSSRPQIVERNGWEKTPSEILISTPRRFGKVRNALGMQKRPSIYSSHTLQYVSNACIRGSHIPSSPSFPFCMPRRARCVPRAQTFSIAIFCSALALSKGLEIVVFSPARRASRKLLERMVE